MDTQKTSTSAEELKRWASVVLIGTAGAIRILMEGLSEKTVLELLEMLCWLF